jgi:hypothetical protein
MAIGVNDFMQDGAGLGGPDKGLGGLVMHGDIFLDGGVEFGTLRNTPLRSRVRKKHSIMFNQEVLPC